MHLLPSLVLIWSFAKIKHEGDVTALLSLVHDSRDFILRVI